MRELFCQKHLFLQKCVPEKIVHKICEGDIVLYSLHANATQMKSMHGISHKTKYVFNSYTHFSFYSIGCFLRCCQRMISVAFFMNSLLYMLGETGGYFSTCICTISVCNAVSFVKEFDKLVAIMNGSICYSIIKNHFAICIHLSMVFIPIMSFFTFRHPSNSYILLSFFMLSFLGFN